MASTNLRLLLDESITEPLATYIVNLVPSAVLSRKTLGAGAKDPSVASFANIQRRTIVAVDSDFKKYDVEWGVIKISGTDRSDDECLFAIFLAFWQSGFRGSARKRRTSLSNHGLIIKNGAKLEHEWHPKPCAHHGGSK
jgi:hypothetical protein